MRNHVAGQPGAERTAQLGGRRRVLGRFGNDHVGGQPRDSLLPAHQYPRVPDGGVRFERGRNLARLHAVAADLHLRVRAAHILQRAARTPTHQISGAVHAFADGEGVGDEPLAGLRRAAEVPPGQLGAGQIELAGRPAGHRSQRGVQHVSAGVPGRSSDRRLVVLRDGGHHRLDRGLGGAVAVVGRHRCARALGADAGPGGFAERFPAQRQHRQRDRAEQTACCELSKHRRGGVDHVETVFGDGGDQRLGVRLGGLGHDVYTVAAQQRDQRLPGGVERERPRVRDAQRPAQPGGRRPQHVVHMIVGVGRHRRVSTDDALGFSCRT
jgi:hypothetical protein